MILCLKQHIVIERIEWPICEQLSDQPKTSDRREQQFFFFFFFFFGGGGVILFLNQHP